MAITIFTTGGTIDDVNYESLEEAPDKSQSRISRMLKNSKVTFEYEIVQLFSKDSRFITDGDRELIAQKCLEVVGDKILITHGTFTMAETFKFLQKKDIQKTLVLVGSFVLPSVEGSDALFNLGFAFGMVQSLPYGIYVTINGRVFTEKDLEKNVKGEYFEPKD